MTEARSRRPLIGLLGAVGVSTLGTRMSLLALPWLVLTTTHSAALTGLVSFAEMAPYVTVQALGGPVIDRVGVRVTSVGTDVLAALFMGTVPVLGLLHALPIPALAALVAVAGAARGAGDAARDVLVPGVNDLAGGSIERASGLYDGVSRLATLIGMPVAGILVAVMPATDVVAIDAATFALSALAVAALVPLAAQPQRHDHGGAPPDGYLTSLREGFGFLARDRLLLAVATMVLVTNFVDQAGSAVLIPVWAHQIVHSSVALGLVGAAFSLGAVAGNAVTTILASRLPRRWTYAVGFFIAGAPRLVAIALISAISPVLAVTFVAGLGAGGINPILGVVEYQRVPRHLQARVLGAVRASAWAAIPVGSLAGGLIVSLAGDRIALLAAAAVYACATLPPFIFPVWQQMNATSAPVASPNALTPGSTLPEHADQDPYLSRSTIEP